MEEAGFKQWPQDVRYPQVSFLLPPLPPTGRLVQLRSTISAHILLYSFIYSISINESVWGHCFSPSFVNFSSTGSHLVAHRSQVLSCLPVLSLCLKCCSLTIHSSCGPGLQPVSVPPLLSTRPSPHLCSRSLAVVSEI